MKSVPFKVLLLTALFLIFTACTPTPNHVTRVGRGSNTRSSGTNVNSTGSGQVSAGIAQFFTNYSNSNGTPFALPCSVSQIGIAAQTDGAVSLSGGVMFSGVDSNGALLQIDFILSCMGQNTDGSTFNDVRVSIAAGQAGFSSASSQQTSSSGYNVTFSDDMGSITLVGNIQGQQFSGNIWYSNDYSILSDGTQATPGASNWLGSFNMPACSSAGGLFQCVQ
jgi:hypothetical protein